jgi:hypothetical protein
MDDSLGAAPPPPKPETFKPPELTSLASLTDGRLPGDYNSVYPWTVWIQIVAEFVFLIAAELVCVGFLLGLAIYVVRTQETGLFFDLLGPYPASAPVVAYLSIALSGVCGGCTFSLKWLYHTVAKMQWHRDRTIWRFVVPVSSGFVALFSGLMIISGLVPFLARAPLMVPATGAAYGFFVGVFSDNVLAALQKLANTHFWDYGYQRPEHRTATTDWRYNLNVHRAR